MKPPVSIGTIFLALFPVLFLLFSFDAATTFGQADLLITGARIRTLDEARPVATSIAIRGDEIIAVDDFENLKRWIGPETRTITLEAGNLVIPGLIESHAHYLGLGDSLMMLDLSNAVVWDDIVRQVRDAAANARPGEWIVGRGWHQSKWATPPADAIDGYPDNSALDSVAPNNPVLLTHASGHMSIANGYAMRLANLTSESTPPSGGEFLRRADNSLTGVLRETAQGPVQRAYGVDLARMSEEERDDRFMQAVKLAGRECWKNGITSFHDAGTSVRETLLLRKVAMDGRLPVRLYVMIRDNPQTIDAMMPSVRGIGMGGEFLTVRALKRSIDGALGPHGAWLLAPYSDLGSTAGLNTDDVQLVRETVELARKYGLQMCVHAIGDRANREVLDMYESVLGEEISRDHRWRIEHAQHLHPDDISRFGSMRVIAAMQAVHCTSDAIFVPQRLGTKRSREGAYVWRSLLDSGAIICNGTDAPVEKIDPLASILASVSRRMPDGSQFYPEQCMTRMEALRSYTIDAAYAAFEESRKGSLTPGKLADITILSKDIVECPENEIAGTKVLFTIIGGRIVYDSSTE